MVIGLRRIFSLPLVFIGTTFVATNYYSIKYAQQVKQYSTDLLLPCLFLIALWTSMQSGSRRSYWSLCVLGTVGVFLLFPAVFFLPISILVVLVSRTNLLPEDVLTRNTAAGTYRDTLLLFTACAVGVLILDVFFVRPNLEGMSQ